MRVDWTQNAIRQLDRVHAYYAEIDRSLASRIFKAIQHAARRLAKFPASGRHSQVPGTRELLVPHIPFVILYRVEAESIQVLRVLHTSTDWQSRIQ